MTDKFPIFKARVPEWLVMVSIFALLLSSVLLFALSTADGTAAAGYYGAEPSDIQFSLLMFYAAVASFAVVERRFFARVVTKDYLLICIVLEILIAYCCYHTRDIWLIFVLRFLQGIVNCGLTSISLNLLFTKLKTEHAKEVGYTIFYGMILGVSPITALFSVPIVENYEYNTLYKAIIFCFLPSAALLYSVLNRTRMLKKMPLYKLDWTSFFLFATLLVLIAYVLIYGQDRDWLEDPNIVFSIAGIIGLAMVSIFRQLSLKRPSVNLMVFRSRNFKIGLLFLVILYLIRGAFSLTSSYFINVLGMDSLHANEMMLFNIAGVVVGSTMAIKVLVLKKYSRTLWMAGFTLLFVFFLWMCLLFASEADRQNFYLPLFLQGVGGGMVMSPIVMFIMSSVPENLSQSASSVGILARFSTFSLSLASINYFQLYFKGKHKDDLRSNLTALDFNVTDRLSMYQRVLSSKGMPKDEAGKAAIGLLNKAVQKQTFLEFCVSYYEIIALLCLASILLIAIQPVISRTVINLRGKQPAAVGF